MLLADNHQAPPDPVPDDDPMPDKNPAPDDEPVPDHHPVRHDPSIGKGAREAELSGSGRPLPRNPGRGPAGSARP